MASSLSLISRMRALKEAQRKIRLERAEARARALVAANPDRLSTDSILVEYAEDPVGFFRDYLLTELWAAQDGIARAVVRNRRVCVRSGHKVGKSKLAAGLGIWWAITRPGARAILTAPTERQVKKAIWYEIQRYYADSPKLRQIMPMPMLAPETGCRWADGRELFGFTASSADNVSGPSGASVFVIVDEGSGVSREVWEALQGIRAGGGKVLALGNPTQTSGWFFDAFHERRAGWEPFKIASTDSPNVVEGRIVIPGLADRDFIQEIADDYDVDSPIYDVRVRGDFPTNVANAVIGLGLIELARARWDDDEEFPGAAVNLGVDVARFGDDDSAICGRRDLMLYTPRWFEDRAGIKAVQNGYDSKKVAGLVRQCLNALRRPGEPARINIDAGGGYGGAVADELRAQQEVGDLDQFVQIVEVNVAEGSSNDEKYPLLRDELWFGGRAFFNAGGALYRDAKAESELIAPTYAPDARGRFKVEKKSETKKRLGRSPDRADAALLAIYEGDGSDTRELQLPQVPLSRWDGQSGRGFG